MSGPSSEMCTFQVLARNNTIQDRPLRSISGLHLLTGFHVNPSGVERQAASFVISCFVSLGRPVGAMDE